MDKKLIDICYKKYNKQIDLSWDQLASQWGYSSGEALRTKFKKYRKANGELQSKEVIRDENIEKKLTELQVQELNLKKERIKLQDLRTSINKDIRYLARQESLNDLIRESIKDLSPIIFKPPETFYGEENEMVIQISDVHFGLTIHNEFEHYDEKVFLERLTNYMSQILNIQQKERINKCHLCFSGDVLSGIIHFNIIRNNQYGIVEQTKKFSEYMSRFIEKLSNHFESLIVHFVTGNHSRNSEEREKSQNKDRYENFVLEFIKLRTENLKNVFFEDSILDNTIAEFYINNHYCVLSHGDYDNPKFAPSKMFSMLGRKPELIFLGHKHVFEVLTVDKCKVITSGAWAIADEYSTNNRLIGEPSQTVTIIGKNGFVLAYDCKLK